MRLLVIAVLAVLAGSTAPAHAASLSLIFSSEEGIGIAEEDRPMTLGANYFVDESEGELDLTVRFRPASAGACASTPGADPGQALISRRVSGSDSVTVQHTEPEPGDFKLCGWLTVPGSGAVSEREERDVRVDQPASSLTMRLATPPLRGVPAVVRAEVSGQPGRLYFGGAGPASAGPCPPAARGAAFEQFFPDGAAIFPSGGLEADGVFGPVPPGDYRACGWLQERADDSQAERAESLEFAIPSARTRTSTAVVGEIYRGRRRTEVFVEVRPFRVRYPFRSGRVVIEWKRVDGFDRFHRAGRPINLARARRFDICVGGDDARDAVRSVVRHPAVGVRIRARYLGSADFRRSRGQAFGGSQDPRDLRGYDRERDRCLRGGPVPSPPREN